MNSPLDSNLIWLIRKAIDECYHNGSSTVDDEKSTTITAEWIDSPNYNDYSLIHITIFKNGVVKFSYDDYATECKN